ADVVVQPYRSATPSGVAQTAFFFDKPMIVTDLGVLAEVVPDGKAGFVVPPEDPAALADAIVRLFKRGPATFTEGVRAQKRKYSWIELADQLAAFLNSQKEIEG
ncbi:MAG: glycosyltransferase, partial [Rhodothermia bacterium]